MRLVSRFVPILLVLACGTASQWPAGLPEPEIALQALSSPFFGSGVTSPLSLEVAITNRAAVPLAIGNIRITSFGMAQYGIRPLEHYVKQTIAPGETKLIAVTAEAVASAPGIRVTEPLTLRTDIDFEHQGKRFRKYATFPRVGM